MLSEPSALPCPGSAVKTADRMNLFLFYGSPVPPGEKRLLLLFLDELHRAPGAYRGLFAFAGGERPFMRFFTGEKAEAGCAVQLSHEIAACLKKIRPAGSRPLIRETDAALSALLSEGLQGDAAAGGEIRVEGVGQVEVSDLSVALHFGDYLQRQGGCPGRGNADHLG